MSVINECLGGTHEFRHKDKVYRVSGITQEVKAEFGKRLFARAREAAAEMRELMTPKEYADHLKALSDDYISGEYAFESQRGINAIKTITGMTLLCSLLFSVGEDEMLKVIVEREQDIAALLKVLFVEAFPRLSEALEESPDDVLKKKGKRTVSHRG